MKPSGQTAHAFLRSPEAGWVLLAAVSLWLAFPNILVQIPIIGLLFPAGLARLAAYGCKRRIFRLGWLASFLGYSACLYWIAIVPHDFAHVPLVAAVPFPLLLGAYMGLYGGLFTLCARLFTPLPPGMRAVALGCVWVCLEYLRGWMLTGFPWLTFSTAFMAWPVWVQAADLVGAYGLSGVMVCCVLLAGFTPARALASKATALLIALALLGYGAFSLNSLEGKEKDLPRKSALLIQSNTDQHIKWTRESIENAVQVHADLTQAGIGRYGEPDLVVWAETAMPFSLRESSGFASPLFRFVRESGISLVTGAPGFAVSQPGKEPALENRAELITPEGVAGFYAKEHLVPFGEYVPPFLDFPFLAFALQEIGRFSPGTNQAPLFLPDGTALGILICYEAIFSGLSAARAAAGAQVFVNISNDAWFGRSPAMLQHLHQASMRSVEQRRWLLRATTNGLTGIVDAGGRVVTLGPSHVPGFLAGEFRPRSDLTVFNRASPFVAPFCAILSVLAIWRRRHYIRRMQPDAAAQGR